MLLIVLFVLALLSLIPMSVVQMAPMLLTFSSFVVDEGLRGAPNAEPHEGPSQALPACYC